MTKHQEKYIKLAKKQRLRKDIQELIINSEYPAEIYEYFFYTRRYPIEVITDNIPLIELIITEKEMFQGSTEQYTEFYKNICKFICKNNGLLSEDFVEFLLINKYISNFLFRGGSLDLILELYETYNIGVKREYLTYVIGSCIDVALCSREKIYLEKRILETFSDESEYGELLSYLFYVWELEEKRKREKSYEINSDDVEKMLIALNNKIPYEEFISEVSKKQEKVTDTDHYSMGVKLLEEKWGALFTEFKEIDEYTVRDKKTADAVNYLIKNNVNGELKTVSFFVKSKMLYPSDAFEITFYTAYIQVIRKKVYPTGKNELQLRLSANGNIEILNWKNNKLIARKMTVKDVFNYSEFSIHENIYFQKFMRLLESHMKTRPAWPLIKKLYKKKTFFVPVTLHDLLEAKTGKDVLKKYKLYNDPETTSINAAYAVSKCYPLVDDESKNILVKSINNKSFIGIDFRCTFTNSVKSCQSSGTLIYLKNILASRVYKIEKKTGLYPASDNLKKFTEQCSELYVMSCLIGKVKVSLKMRSLFEILSECESIAKIKAFQKRLNGHELSFYSYMYHLSCNTSDILPKIEKKEKMLHIPAENLTDKYRIVSDPKGLFDAAMITGNFNTINKIINQINKGKIALIIYDNKDVIKIKKGKKNSLYCDDSDPWFVVNKDQKMLLDYLLN
ncbi:hypothetical protein [Ruminococcus sp.]|uniref:hypothetical protein n=1 Tax=Ruminococcus sp. TaxID=41978 RepID=UPI00258DD41C|nr:hypothetical protein [Ruminococcus sp.]MCR5021310.1 hypothetical protein [Ruminococcus sp.]